MSTKDKSKSVGLEIVRFLVVGVLATMFDFATKLFAANGLAYIGIDGEIYADGKTPAGLNYTLSIVCGFVVGVIVNYVLSRIWVFQNVEDKKKANSSGKFFLFVFLGFIGLLISLAIFWGAVIVVPLINKEIDIFAGSKSVTFDPNLIPALLKNLSFWAYVIVFCVSTLIVLVWNYISRKKWIFIAPKEEKEETRVEVKTSEAPKKEALKVEAKEEKDAEAKKAEKAEEKPAAKEKVEEKAVEEASPAPAKEEIKTPGKYEVFPEAGGYKYRLKANNGEILIVSNVYSTKKGALSGIETLKKNLADGVKSVQTDKNGYSQFRIFTPNDGRLIATGEVYKSVDSANSALNSALKFGGATKVVELDEIPESEMREWAIDVKVEDKPGGKIEYFTDENANNKWRARLFANNGQLMFVTDGAYASKSGAMSAIASITKLIDSNSFHVLKDKQDRYQFQLASSTGAVLVRGETYDSKERAISAATSVASFINNAKVIEPKAQKVEEEAVEAKKTTAKTPAKKVPAKKTAAKK
ncbi:MAG: DUF1508 domain-containing protein [Bacilli bacterium]|nr:DUF1508 domain-containing protein [Bacilli bacterium]